LGLSFNLKILPWCYFPLVTFFGIQKKNNPHISVLTGFLEFYVLKYMTKSIAI